jgi:hypothetical protein
MRVEPTSETAFERRLTGRAAWIGPASGFACSVLVTLIGRATDFAYRRETSMAVFFLVSILVTGYYSGRLTRRPASVVGLAIVASAVAVAIARW